MHGHHQLFQSGITSAFTDAIHRALQLTRSRFHGLKEIGDGQPEIVVAMHGNHRVIDIRHMLIDARDQAPKFRRCGVSHRVWNIHGAGTSSNRRFDHFVQKLRITATRVFTGKLNVVHEGTGIGHHLGNDAKHVFTTLAQFVLEMNVAGGDKGMDASLWGRCYGLSAGLDVAAGGAG